MFSEERRDEILQILKRQKSVNVKELAANLFVTPITIRRDLAALEHDGVVRRSHGGAILIESISDEASFSVRELEHLKEKKAMAELAITFIKPHQTLFIDSSSTAGMLIARLSDISALSVITNGLKNAQMLAQYTDAKVLVCGGTLNTSSNSLTGSDACRFLNRLNANLCILSCNGLDIAGGVTEVSVEQSRIKEVMLKNARTRILLCDSSKFATVAMSRTCNLDAFDFLITDCAPPAAWETFAAQCNCKILYPHQI
ncbi:MAG: DeoR/GlpR family DNA-binding transcription regulator [Ruthenibacterium sp.]